MKLEKFLIGLYSIPLTALLVPFMLLWQMTLACWRGANQIAEEYLDHILTYKDKK